MQNCYYFLILNTLNEMESLINEQAPRDHLAQRTGMKSIEIEAVGVSRNSIHSIMDDALELRSPVQGPKYPN